MSNNPNNTTSSNLSVWEALAEKELRGKGVNDLVWNSPEGIQI